MQPLGLCSYETPAGSYTFSEQSEIVALRGKYLYDRAGRTVVATQWTISIRDRVNSPNATNLTLSVFDISPSGIVSTNIPHDLSAGDSLNGGTAFVKEVFGPLQFSTSPAVFGPTIAATRTSIDKTMESIRRVLSQAGGEFALSAKGFGDLSANFQDWKLDATWGPKPISFDFRIQGRDQAAEFTWTVQVTLPEMCEKPQYAFALMELCYNVTYTTDALGFGTRVTDGEFVIPETRQSLFPPDWTTTSDTADNYYSKIYQMPPAGYRRVSNTRNISDDSRTLTWQWVDVQCKPVSLPAGITDCEVHHSIRSTSSNFYQWAARIIGRYHVALDQVPGLALVHFLRLAYLRALASSQYGGVTIIPTALGIDESVFNPTEVNLSLEYALTFSTESLLGQTAPLSAAPWPVGFPMQTIAQNAALGAGLWSPVGTDDSSWRTSMVQFTWSPYGPSQAMSLEGDSIMTLCDPTPKPAQVTASLVPPGTPPQLLQEIFPPPSPDTSWLGYVAWIELSWDNAVATMKSLPPQPPTGDGIGPQQRKLIDPSDLDKSLFNDLGNPPAMSDLMLQGFPAPDNSQGNITVPRADQFMQRTVPRIKAHLKGYAMRAAFNVTPPQLTQLGGQPVTQAGGSFAQWPVGNLSTPIVGAVWSLSYLVPGMNLAPLLMPCNPAMLVQGASGNSQGGNP